MNSALRIFKKDVRHLWPRIVLVVGIEVLARWAASAPWLGMAGAHMGLGAIETLAQWFLIASVVHEEPLVGDRQYWLTRPFSWKALLAAKLLFFLVFIHLPVLAADVSALILRGQSPVAHLPGLAIAQFFTLATVVLSGAALASISASLVQFVWVFLAAVVSSVAILETIAFQVGGNVSWGGLEWLHAAATAAFTMSGATAIVAVQYAARKTGLSRSILAAGVLATVLMNWMPGWHAAFALQSWLSGRRVPYSLARVAQDSPRGLEAAPLRRSFWGRQRAVAVEIPVLVTGIPPGMGLQSDRVAATGVAPEGRAWSSAWDPINRLSQVIGDEKTTREERILPGDDTWLYVNATRDPLGPWHATAALTLLSEEEITPLGAGRRPARVPQGGLCWITGKQNLMIVCSWPAPAPGYAAARIRAKGMPAGMDTPLLEFGGLSYGPCSNSGGL